MSLIFKAFEACCDGFSADRVVVDPDLNVRFIRECRNLGLVESVSVLNHRLLNLRKRGLLARYKTRVKTSFHDEDSYRFAAEIAARFMERKTNTTLDKILCDPIMASEFDQTAEKIAPGYTALQYRWAALNLRKLCGLKPELASRIASQPVAVHLWKIADLQLSSVPFDQGLYLFHDSQTHLYIGEAENLRLRIKKHLDHSDNKALARWLWEGNIDDLHLEVHVLAPDITSRARKALELELIRSRNPTFNVKR